MNTRDISNKQENFVALMLGGTTTPNSGAGHTKKGDILIDDFGVLGDEYAVIPLNDYKEFLEYKRGNK